MKFNRQRFVERRSRFSSRRVKVPLCSGVFVGFLSDDSPATGTTRHVDENEASSSFTHDFSHVLDKSIVLGLERCRVFLCAELECERKK